MAASVEAEISRLHDALRFVLGGTAFAAGADKFLNLLTDWEQYLSPGFEKRIPVSPKNFMRLVGVVEMVVGGAILTKRTRLGGYVASAWLLCISAILISSGEYFDIAARDVNMAVGAFALARLSELQNQSSSRKDRSMKAA